MDIPAGRIKTHHLVLWIVSKTMGIMSNLNMIIGVDVHNNQRKKKKKEKRNIGATTIITTPNGWKPNIIQGNLGFRV
jgi:hypothetical protein